MIHRKTYRILEDGPRELVYEEMRFEDGRISYYLDYQAENTLKVEFDYDENKRLRVERELEIEDELSRTEYEYTEDGEIISQKLYVSGDLYEEKTVEVVNEKQVRKTLRMDEEVLRTERIELKDGQETHYYEYGELTQRHRTHYNDTLKTDRTEVYDTDNQLIYVETDVYNDKEQLLKSECYDAGQNLMSFQERWYEKENCVKEKLLNENNYQMLTAVREFDEDWNIVGEKLFDENNKPLGFFQHTYDKENRLVREEGLGLVSENSIYANYIIGSAYEFEHEYVNHNNS